MHDDDNDGGIATLDRPKTRRAVQTRRKPSEPPYEGPWHVILHNDDHHSFPYVIRVLQEVFKHKKRDAEKLTKLIHDDDKAIVYTCHKELAELKQEQVHSFGKDPLVASCEGALSSTIEPAA